jgi:hypothetical protein
LLQVTLEQFLQVEAGMIRRDRDAGPRHLDDRSPLAVETPDTISGVVALPAPKIVESEPQDAEIAKKKARLSPGPLSRPSGAYLGIGADFPPFQT